MDYYGLLFLYYLKGLSGKSILRLFFNIEVGGTEELLPSSLLNGWVDLGTLDYTMGSNNVFISTGDFAELPAVSTTSVPSCYLDGYTALNTSVAFENIPNKSVICNSPAITVSRRTISIRDESYSDAQSFKSAMAGKILYFQTGASTPSTSPILADVQYPDGLRTDQYFTYRETPTTVSNKARIKTIKGNTLVWNQLFQSNHSLTIVTTDTGTKVVENLIPVISGHKYLLLWTQNITLTSNTRNTPAYYIGTGSSTYQTPNTNANLSSGRKSWIFTVATSGNMTITYWGYEPNAQFVVSDFNLIDLTVLGLDITADEFLSLFPLPYYAYNAGTLLSFNGTGIKTTGKNLLPILPSTLTTNGITFTKNDDGTVTANGTATGVAFYFFNSPTNSSANLTEKFEGLVGRTVTVNGAPRGSGNNKRIMIGQMPGGGSYANDTGTGATFVMRENTFIAIRIVTGETCNNDVYKPMLIPADTDDTFEPYTSSTISLPISTYFPTGMKSAGTVYDELTPSKAITRLGIYDLGLLDWTTGSGWSQARDSALLGAKAVDDAQIANTICPIYTPKSANEVFSKTTDKTIAINQGGYVQIYDSSFANKTTAEIKQLLSGVYLYYELATPTETPIATEDANEALSLLMGKSVSSNNAKQMINIITKGE